MSLTTKEIHELEIFAIELRDSVLNMLVHAKSGHTAGPLGMADVFGVLYGRVLNHNPDNPAWENRDRVILSNGHICPILYAAMGHSGYLDMNNFYKLRKFGSMLQGHPHREFLKSLETSSGPLGCGLSQAIGMALGSKIKDKNSIHKKIFYVFMGDGEMNEGNVWEALLLLAKEKLSNIIIIIDRNKIQIDGHTEHVLPLEPLAHKLEKFNFNIINIDGHNVSQIYEAFTIAKNNSSIPDSRPSIIIANTIPGKGYKKIEGDYHWHGKAPNEKEYNEALEDMRTLYGRLNV
jgi:transketolase